MNFKYHESYCLLFEKGFIYLVTELLSLNREEKKVREEAFVY